MALWIAHYGYPAIFFLLIGGIVGFPVPDQLLLIISGYLVLTGSLSMTPTLIAAILGSICGITISYFWVGVPAPTCQRPVLRAAAWKTPGNGLNDSAVGLSFLAISCPESAI